MCVCVCVCVCVCARARVCVCVCVLLILLNDGYFVSVKQLDQSAGKIASGCSSQNDEHGVVGADHCPAVGGVRWSR